MSHAFLDIETLCKKPSAVMTEIAGVEFDPRTFEIGRTLSLELCADDQVMRGRTVCEETLAWHVEQGHEISMGKGIDLSQALDNLTAWIAEVAPERVWIWGPDFDRPILDNAFLMVGGEIPWPYYKTMDGRTVWNLAFPTTKRPKRPHASLGDCLAGINDLRAALVKLNLVETEVSCDCR